MDKFSRLTLCDGKVIINNVVKISDNIDRQNIDVYLNEKNIDSSIHDSKHLFSKNRPIHINIKYLSYVLPIFYIASALRPLEGLVVSGFWVHIGVAIFFGILFLILYIVYRLNEPILNAVVVKDTFKIYNYENGKYKLKFNENREIIFKIDNEDQLYRWHPKKEISRGKNNNIVQLENS